MARHPILLALLVINSVADHAHGQFVETATVVAVSGIHAASGPIAVDATIGQPFAMRLEGAGYVADLGFWTPKSMLPTAVGDAPAAMPAEFALEQNYPNPFNPATVIRYALPDAGHVKLTVFDSSGRRVADLINTTRPAGYHEVRFDAGDLPSGVYLYRLEGPGANKTQAMLLTR